MGRSRVTKPTRKQKILMQSAGLVPKNWLVLKETTEELIVVNRGSGRTRRVKKVKKGYTVKNPGRGTGYRLPLNNDKIRLQRTSYGDAIYGELPDVVAKMEQIMKFENWKTMLDTVPVEEWPVYIKKSRSEGKD